MMLKAVVAVLMIGYNFPTDDWKSPPTQFMGQHALADCMQAATAFLEAAEKQMPSGGKAYVRCEIER